MGDRILLTLAMLASYGASYALIRWTLGLLVPGRAAPDGLPLILAGMPLLLCVLFEWATGLWDRTPGSMGLGSLTVALPMALAGAGAAAAFLLLRGFGPEAAAGLGREALGPVTTVWGVATIGIAILSLALWRFWPAPTPRLF